MTLEELNRIKQEHEKIVQVREIVALDLRLFLLMAILKRLLPVEMVLKALTGQKL